MTPLAAIFLAVATCALLFGPNRWGTAVFVWTCCLLGYGEGIELGAASFWLMRVFIVVGFVKILFIKPWPPGGWCRLDYLILAFGIWLLASSVFHVDPAGNLIEKCGTVLEGMGAYFVARRLTAELESPSDYAWTHAILFIPIAILMAVEYTTLTNYFGYFGLGHWEPLIRDGRPRAYGPFQHPILAGTIGATAVPLFVGILRSRPATAVVGTTAALTMVLTSASSGPIVALTGGVAALLAWPLRRNMRQLRWGIVGFYVALDLIMKAPAYYLMSRIDLTGSSTGWHRAALIESGIQHINEWWLGGTDYTRHWMPTGVTWSEKHTDITNQYLSYGVNGGVLLMALFVAVLAHGFAYLGRHMKQASEGRTEYEFFLWCAGSTLFAHTFAFFSVRYYDQSLTFVFVLLALISTIYQTALGRQGSLPDASEEGGNMRVAKVWKQEATDGGWATSWFASGRETGALQPMQRRLVHEDTVEVTVTEERKNGERSAQDA